MRELEEVVLLLNESFKSVIRWTKTIKGSRACDKYLTFEDI
jgi:hypothetical protein